MEISLGTTSTTYLWLYLGLTGVLAVLTFLANFFLTKFSLTAAQKLHDEMLGAILRTKL